ncbi:MAG: energy-coupling factor transporter ATPase [Oscillospiraceae bacterium]|nr:energy-coupling factor transporter ATPase [Oscillospiraceae bacterium]
MSPIIKTDGLSHIYSAGTVFEQAAIKDINVEINRGEFVGVIGHTGSGKSTLIQHFNGLLKPTSGKIFVEGEDIWEKPREIRRFRFKVGLVFQYPEYQLFEDTVYKDIAFGPTNMGLAEEEVDKRVREAAAFVELKPELLEKSPFELSGGQKRRAAIAGVIAMNPEVLILDEPTAGLDPRGRDRILGEIKEYHEQRSNTVLLVSHNMEDIARYAAKVMVLNQSRVFMYDTVESVFSRARELQEMGLSVPQVTKICLRLAQAGVEISPQTYTIKSAKARIIELLGRKRPNEAE